jgi:hypothetical protein
MIAYVTVIEKKRIVYRVHVDDLEDAYTEYAYGKVEEEVWLEERVEDVEYDMEPPEVDWEDHEERPFVVQLTGI